MKNSIILSALLATAQTASAFTCVKSQTKIQKIHQRTKLYMGKETMTEDELKADLSAYLAKRKEANADESAKGEVGKVVGGTKGNAILEFVSGAPNKALVIEDVPDIFDYSELAKYGYSYLATPIMNAGGRREMYNLMGLPAPATKERIRTVKKVPKLVIDREGQTDQARYSGLKVTQALDDDEMGRALENAMKKKKAGEELRKKLEEETYELPFADKRNTGPKQTPDWTPERLDEEGRKAGQAMAWARKARAGEFKKDKDEMLNITGVLQAYSILTTVFIAIVFGNSTPKAMQLLGLTMNQGLIEDLQGPAFAMVVASIGSAIFCATQASSKNRSAFVWAVKGYAGGPLAVFQVQSLDNLITRGEAEAESRDNASE